MENEFIQMTEDEFKEYKQGQRDYLSMMADRREATIKRLTKFLKRDKTLLERLPVRIKSRTRSLEKTNNQFIDLCLQIDKLDELKIEQCKTRRVKK